MATPTPGSARLVEANMRRWLEREKLDQKIQHESASTRLGPYIVVSRQCGANGPAIAEMIAKNEGWELLDLKIVESVTQTYDISEQLVELVDERHVTWLTEIFESWLESKEFCQEGYVHTLSRLLLIAAQHGDFVMVGRGAQFILPREFGLFVRLHAPLESRVANICRSRGLLEKDAVEFIAERDKQRAAYLKMYFQNDGTDEQLYDLMIDTSRFSIEAAAELISQASKLRTIL